MVTQRYRNRNLVLGRLAQRHADCVADTLGKQRPYADCAFDSAVFRVSGFCNSKMQGVGHPVLRHPLHEQSYGFHHHGGVGSFDGNNDISEIHLTAYVKKLHDRFHHTCRSVAITAHYTV